MKNYIVKIKICGIKKRDTVIWIMGTELEWDKVPQGKERLLSWVWRASQMNSLHRGANVSGTASHAEGTPCSKDIVFLSYGQQNSISLTRRWKPNAAAPLDPSTPSFLFPLHLLWGGPQWEFLLHAHLVRDFGLSWWNNKSLHCVMPSLISELSDWFAKWNGEVKISLHNR